MGHNLSPRGDGNIVKLSRINTFRLCHNLSPRGDGNPRRIRSKATRLRHNLSPRGDGNCSTWKTIQIKLPSQLIPARGRKLERLFKRFLVHVTTYPRKGTKKALSEKTERAFSCLQRVCIYVNRQKNKAAIPFRYSGLFLIRIYSTIRPCRRNRTVPSSPSR